MDDRQNMKNAFLFGMQKVQNLENHQKWLEKQMLEDRLERQLQRDQVQERDRNEERREIWWRQADNVMQAQMSLDRQERNEAEERREIRRHESENEMRAMMLRDEQERIEAEKRREIWRQEIENARRDLMLKDEQDRKEAQERKEKKRQEAEDARIAQILEEQERREAEIRKEKELPKESIRDQDRARGRGGITIDGATYAEVLDNRRIDVRAPNGSGFTIELHYPQVELSGERQDGEYTNERPLPNNNQNSSNSWSKMCKACKQWWNSSKSSKA